MANCYHRRESAREKPDFLYEPQPSARIAGVGSAELSEYGLGVGEMRLRQQGIRQLATSGKIAAANQGGGAGKDVGHRLDLH